MRVIALLIVAGAPALAQAPSFEAASIRPSTDGVGDVRSYKTDPGRLTYTNVSLRDCIKQAWNLKDYQVEGPKFLTALRFNIVATAGNAAPEDQMKQMLQGLLIERFKMAVRMDTRELPAYALTAGNKVRVQPSAPDTVAAKGLDGGNLFFRHISMEQFAEVLSGFKGRPVLDNTGLSGFYDVRLDIFEDPADMRKSMIRGDFGDVAAAAVESQLGLRIEPRKSPIPMLIVDQAEKIPIEN